jgi:hypothetical protein
MSSKPHALPNQITTKRAGFWSQDFYFFMSLLIAATVVYGFSHTVDHNLIHASPLPPSVLYIHAIVFPGWVVFFIVQSALIRSHNVRVHRRLGWFGVGLAVAVVVLGAWTSASMVRFSIEHKDPFNSTAFTIVQVMDLACFAVPFALAIYWPKKPEFHRRLVLVASCALLDAAFGRFPELPLVFSPAGVDADLSRSDPRPHRRAPGSQSLPLRAPNPDRLPNRRHGDIRSRVALVDECRQPHPSLARRVLQPDSQIEPSAQPTFRP